MRAESVAEIVLRHIKEAVPTRGDHELEWLNGEVGKIAEEDDRRFFALIAERDDSVAFLRWCLYIVRDPADLKWVVCNAKNTYLSLEPRRPDLLAVMKDFDK